MSVSRGSKIFVAVIFSVLGLSFWATTGTLIYEFYQHDWFAHLALYSHLFVFFPTFGIFALFALGETAKTGMCLLVSTESLL